MIGLLINNFIELSKICINGNNHHMNQTAYNLKSTNATGFMGQGPNGSGPIENDEELVCDILTEMISALFKIFNR